MPGPLPLLGAAAGIAARFAPKALKFGRRMGKKIAQPKSAGPKKSVPHPVKPRKTGSDLKAHSLDKRAAKFKKNQKSFFGRRRNQAAGAFWGWDAYDTKSMLSGGPKPRKRSSAGNMATISKRGSAASRRTKHAMMHNRKTAKSSSFLHHKRRHSTNISRTMRGNRG